MKFPQIALALCWAAGPAAGAVSLEQILARMDAAARGFQAMTADIRKVQHTHVINADDEEEGRVMVKRTGKKGLRMLTELTKPDEKAVAFDGARLELFYPKLNKVDVYDAGRGKGLVEQFFLLGFGMPRADLERDYAVTLGGEETVAGQTAVRLELIPKSAELKKHIRKAELWILPSSGNPVQQKFHQSGGDYHVVTYTNLKINPALTDQMLRLKLPKGVERTRR